MPRETEPRFQVLKLMNHGTLEEPDYSLTIDIPSNHECFDNYGKTIRFCIFDLAPQDLIDLYRMIGEVIDRRRELKNLDAIRVRPEDVR